MARRPNYRFDRMERERAKANKRALRATARAEKAKARTAEAIDPELAPESISPPEATSPADGFPEKPES